VFLGATSASGNVNVQAQSAALSLTAKQAVDLQSTQASIHISAPQRITLNGAGSYVLIDGGNIELGTSGPAQFKAAAKELAGGGSAQADLPSLPRPIDWHVAQGDQYFKVQSHDGRPVAHRRYRAHVGHRKVEGFTGTDGCTQVLKGHLDQLAKIELVTHVYDEHFILRTPAGTPMANVTYKIRSASGVELTGRTDSEGKTQLFTGDQQEQLELLLTPQQFADDEGHD